MYYRITRNLKQYYKNENELIKIKNYCINNNITFKDYILQKIKE